MASTLQKLLIPIFGYCDSSISLVKSTLLKIYHTSISKHFVDFNPYSLMFHTLHIQRSSFVLITLQVTLTFTCGMEFYYFNNHSTTIMQGCYNSARLRPPCTNYHNVVTTLSQSYKVAARLLQPSYFRMGDVCVFCCSLLIHSVVELLHVVLKV